MANSLLLLILKLTNTCFIALSHAKSIILLTQHKSVTYIILPGYSKSPEARVHTVCIWHSESDMEAPSVMSWENFQTAKKHFFFFFSSSSLHALVCTTLLMFVLVIYLSHICHSKFGFSKLKSIVFQLLHFPGKIEPLQKVKESNQMGKNLLISYLSYFVRHKPPH